MRDVTEYQFRMGQRQLTVRSTQATIDNLADFATKLAANEQRFTKLRDVTIGPVSTTTNGATTTTIRGACNNTQTLLIALLHWPTGLLVEMRFLAPTVDSTAAEQFQQLVASARPSLASAETAVRHGLAAPPTGANYPVGAVVLDLPAAYVPPTSFVLESPDGQERYHMSRAPMATLASMATPVARTNLADAVPTLVTATTVGADGYRVKYEVTSIPPPATFAAPLDALPTGVTTHAMRAPATAARTSAEVVGHVKGVAVRVNVTGTTATAAKAEELLRTLAAQ